MKLDEPERRALAHILKYYLEETYYSTSATEIPYRIHAMQLQKRIDEEVIESEITNRK